MTTFKDAKRTEEILAQIEADGKLQRLKSLPVDIRDYKESSVESRLLYWMQAQASAYRNMSKLERVFSIPSLLTAGVAVMLAIAAIPVPLA